MVNTSLWIWVFHGRITTDLKGITTVFLEYHCHHPSGYQYWPHKMNVTSSGLSHPWKNGRRENWGFLRCFPSCIFWSKGSPPSFRGHQPDSLQLLGRQQCASHRNLHLNILKKMNMKTQRPNGQKSGKVFVCFLWRLISERKKNRQGISKPVRQCGNV